MLQLEVLRRRNRLALAIEVAEMPSLRRRDQTTDELAVNQLAEPASAPTPAANQPPSDKRRPPSPHPAMHRVPVLRVVGLNPHPRLTPTTAIALVLGDRRVLAPAPGAAANTVGGVPPRTESHRAGRLAAATEGLVSVRGVERPASTAYKASSHESPGESVFLGQQLGREEFRAALSAVVCVKNGMDTGVTEVCCRCGGVFPDSTSEGGGTVNEDQVKGKAKQAEGQGQESWGDAKEKADETWEEAKDKLDDLGDKIGEIKDKLAKDTLGHDDEDDEGSRTSTTRPNRESAGRVAVSEAVGMQRGGRSAAVALCCGARRRRSSSDVEQPSDAGPMVRLDARGGGSGSRSDHHAPDSGAALSGIASRTARRRSSSARASPGSAPPRMTGRSGTFLPGRCCPSPCILGAAVMVRRNDTGRRESDPTMMLGLVILVVVAVVLAVVVGVALDCSSDRSAHPRTRPLGRRMMASAGRRISSTTRFVEAQVRVRCRARALEHRDVGSGFEGHMVAAEQ